MPLTDEEEKQNSMDAYSDTGGSQSSTPETPREKHQPALTVPRVKPLRVLVACEFSGVVRRAFRALGHDAWSCDLLPAEDKSEFHFDCPVEDVPAGYGNVWDLLIAHPPCTHLAVSGARHFAEKRADGRQEEAIDFFLWFCDFHASRICIENPVSIMSTVWRKPDQIIQPWMFGHGETKATCLWLKNLPKLAPTSIVEGRAPRVHHASPGPDRWKERSRTLPGIAAAMAMQWGGIASAAN